MHTTCLRVPPNDWQLLTTLMSTGDVAGTLFGGEELDSVLSELESQVEAASRAAKHRAQAPAPSSPRRTAGGGLRSSTRPSSPSRPKSPTRLRGSERLRRRTSSRSLSPGVGSSVDSSEAEGGELDAPRGRVLERHVLLRNMFNGRIAANVQVQWFCFRSALCTSLTTCVCPAPTYRF